MNKALAALVVLLGTAVLLSGQSTQSAAVNGPRTVGVRGRIVVEDEGLIPNLTPLDARGPMIPLRLDFASSVGSVSPSVKPDGTFVAILPEGTYRVTVAAALPRTYEIRSFTYGSANVLTSALVIRPDALEEFVLRLRTSDKPVKVMGRVVGVNGLTKVEGSVRLRRQGFVSVLETTVGAGGAIEFPRVYPGEYTLEPAVPGLVGYRWFVVGDKDITDLELFVGRK